MLEMTDLRKHYGDVAALDGLDLTARPGRLLGFLGPNGAGKTTAMRAVFGLVGLDTGRVRWHGHPVTQGDRLHFGYMPEQRGLYPRMPAAAQLTYLARLHGMERDTAEAAAATWLERLDLADRAEDAVSALSHGNQQRVQLAASLVHEPDLLVLDEPFSGLDPLGVAAMSEVLRDRARAGATVVFSSHQLDLVEDLCDDVAIISQGRIVAMGNVARLKAAAPIRHLELEMEGSADSVLSLLDGVRSAEVVDGRHVLTIDAEADVRQVLAEAERGGVVRHFVYTAPSLTDLFREAVA